MPEPTLEDLARRVEPLERKLAELAPDPLIPPTRDWRSVVGVFDEFEAMPQFIIEGRAIREAERAAAREGRDR